MINKTVVFLGIGHHDFRFSTEAVKPDGLSGALALDIQMWGPQIALILGMNHVMIPRLYGPLGSPGAMIGYLDTSKFAESLSLLKRRSCPLEATLRIAAPDVLGEHVAVFVHTYTYWPYCIYINTLYNNNLIYIYMCIYIYIKCAYFILYSFVTVSFPCTATYEQILI